MWKTVIKSREGGQVLKLLKGRIKEGQKIWFWPGFYATGYIPEKTYPCADSLLQPWKICLGKMHTMWRMTVCAPGCRDRCRLKDQWMGQKQEGGLLSHPSIYLPLRSLQRKRLCLLSDRCGNTAVWKWWHWSLKAYSSPSPHQLCLCLRPSFPSPRQPLLSASHSGLFTGPVRKPPAMWMLERKG